MSIFSFLKNKNNSIQSINAADFKAIIADKNVQLIDVRTPEEYAQGTIEKAKLIDVSANDFEKKIEKLDKNRPVAVFCHSGPRSRYAAKIFSKKGFSPIYNLKGGMMFWR